MRKRAQRKSKPIEYEPKHIVQRARPMVEEKKQFKLNKNWWIAIALVGIFFIVLLHNTYYNATQEIAINEEGEGFAKFYLSGPDPYYNMRLVEKTYETGVYPYYSEPDPLLNYPLGSRGQRAPLFNMMAIGFGKILSPFMNEIDAIGYSMLFLPALFGALLIFPVYFIGKAIYGRKAGLVAAFFIAIIPIHLASGHGSAYSLFDHDSFNLLLFFLTFLFLIKSLKEKDSSKALLYAILAGIPLAGLSMTWVEARFLYTVIGIYAIVQMLIDIIANKIQTKVFITTSAVLWTGFIVSLPVLFAEQGKFPTDLSFFLCLGVSAFGFMYYLFGRKKIPWTISIPSIASFAIVALVALYYIDNLIKMFSFLSPLRKFSDIIYGGSGGIYANKVSQTIAEANTYQISPTIMSFGPAIYWIAWTGLILTLYCYYKQKFRRDFLFVIVLFLVNLWLTGTAGRFLNDMTPWIAILGGWVICIVVDRVDFKQMIRNVKSAGGGLHGIRRGVKLLHIFGIIFIGFIVILPNAFIAFDAAIPNKTVENPWGDDPPYITLKENFFGEDFQGANGLGIYKEKYWGAAFDWLSKQDLYDSEGNLLDPTEKPAFISWWDYGFYESALGDHPTVADNFQDGIPPAGNFHTSTSEEEAVIVWIVRLMEGDRLNNGGTISDNVKDVLTDHLGSEKGNKIVGWLNDQSSAESYGRPIGEGKDYYYHNVSKDYPVGQQYPDNAVYHDVVNMLTNETDGLTDEEITNLYHDIQETTGYSIRYYGVEGYDENIFNIFGFLADKSLILVGAPEDDFVTVYFTGVQYDEYGNIISENERWSAREYLEKDKAWKQYNYPTNQDLVYKDLYYETMFYKTYIGITKENEDGTITKADWQVPCNNMKHFYAEYMSDLKKGDGIYQYYGNGKAAVVIAKYYEGALLNGTVTYKGTPLDVEVVVQKNLTYYEGMTLPIDHDKYSMNTTNNDFKVIAGAGSRLQIRKNLGDANFPLKNITFNGENGTEFEPISEEDAMRKNGSNYIRNLEITIDSANLEGYFYEDLDNDGVFNKSSDKTMSDGELILYEITSVNNNQIQTGNQYILEINVTTGYYNISDIMPGIYRLILTRDNNYIVHLNDLSLSEGNTTYNIAEPKPANVEGIVYYDFTGTTEFDDGEEIAGANVELLISTTTGEISIDNTTTASNGSYSFKTLIPGQYNSYLVRAIKDKLYDGEVSFTVEEGLTKTQNISLSLTKVTVSGKITNETNPVEATMTFMKDKSIEGNTADEMQETRSLSNGSYSIDLTPGDYNITIEELSGDVIIYQYTDGKLTIAQGIGTLTDQNYEVEKKTVTVSGFTTYEGNNRENVTIRFTNNTQVANNTADALVETISSETGSYIVELTPGSYKIEAFNETGENRYSSASFDLKLTLKTDEISTGKPNYNIPIADEVIAEES